MILITAFIEYYGECGYIAYTEKFKGLVVQAKTLDDLKRELLKSLKVKVAYDYGLDIRNIEGKELTTEEIQSRVVRETDNEMDFALM